MKTIIALLCLTCGVVIAANLVRTSSAFVAESAALAVQELDLASASATSLLQSADQFYALKKWDEFGLRALCANVRLAAEVEAFPPKSREAKEKSAQARLTAQRLLLLVVREAALGNLDLDDLRKLFGDWERPVLRRQFGNRFHGD